MFAAVTMEVNANMILNSDLSIDVNRSSTGTYRINGGISGSGGINLVGPGTLTLNGAATFTGSTILGSGALKLGAANRLSDASAMVFDGGTLFTDGFSDDMGTLSLLSDSFIDLGAGDSDITFLDSSALSWDGASVLNISNFVEGVDSIRFGTSASGLTSTQLSQIFLNGEAVTLDSNGFLTVAVPEPGTYALLVGIGILGLTAARRRR